MVEVIQRGDLMRSLRSLREMQPWSAPLLFAHLQRSYSYFSHLHIILKLWWTFWTQLWLNLLLSRLYEKHGEAAVRLFSQFYPTITPADVMTMAHESHFLAYLDNLVQSRTEEHRYLSFCQKKKENTPKSLLPNLTFILFSRLSFLQSLLEPESLRQDWLELALTHDAPQRCDTLTPNGEPRSGSVNVWKCKI